MSWPDDRYPWRVPVRALGKQREVGIGVEDGDVIFSLPPGEWMAADPDEADSLAAEIMAAAERAREHRRRRF